MEQYTTRRMTTEGDPKLQDQRTMNSRWDKLLMKQQNYVRKVLKDISNVSTVSKSSVDRILCFDLHF